MKFIDFFAGIGGFRSGMTKAGHECVGYVEIDKFAVKSYKEMYKTEGEYYANDIRTVKSEDLPKAEIYTAGFPCQAFSIAGNRRGFEDTRGTLIFEVLRLAKDRKPKYLFLENVKGIFSHDKGRTFATILLALDELGYDAEWQCINSKNYVPQNRERVYIIGHFRGERTRKVFPFGGENEATLEQVVGGTQGDRVYSKQGISCTLNSQGGGGGAKTGLYLVDEAKINVVGSFVEGRQRTRVYNTDGIMATLVATEYKDPKKILVQACLTPDRTNKRQNGRRFKEEGEPMFTLTSQDMHGVNINERIRRLTPLECFRLQCFTDEQFYKAQSVNSDSQLYKQAGNSVTVDVIYDIAKRFS